MRVNNNYYSSIKKWEKFKNIVWGAELLSKNDRERYWYMFIWEACGFCEQFMSDVSTEVTTCVPCPLYPKYCAAHLSEGMMSNIFKTFTQEKYTEETSVEVETLVGEFIEEMKKHKHLFKGRAK